MTSRLHQSLVAAGTLALGGFIAVGATGISTEAGYGGVGPNFLPWVVGLALVACGGWLLWQALSGGFRVMDEPSGEARGHWPGFVWVSAGLLADALTIERIGFILACTLCFLLAVRGFRSAEGRRDWSLRGILVDAAIGLAISAPVYWMFTQLLSINLPSLTGTGWL